MATKQKMIKFDTLLDDLGTLIAERLPIDPTQVTDDILADVIEQTHNLIFETIGYVPGVDIKVKIRRTADRQLLVSLKAV